MGFINPSAAILKTWQGIAEIALRVACGVSFFFNISTETSKSVYLHVASCVKVCLRACL